ncbi:hypothetical protein KI387_021619, partial [Taxus chinensis]
DNIAVDHSNDDCFHYAGCSYYFCAAHTQCQTVSDWNFMCDPLHLYVPNGIGFLLGIIQLTVYLIYRNPNPVLPTSIELPETRKIDGRFDMPVQIIVPVEKSKNNKVAAVDTIIAVQV